jgi:DNA-directed RNA polymerase subunit RPC12/RpoP
VWNGADTVEKHVRPPLLDQAISAVQIGDLAGGRRMLAHVLGGDPRNEEAWLWLSTAVDDLAQRTDCLRRVLALNPHNRVAWERLASLTSADPDRDRPVIERATIREFPCPQCAGDLRWDIGQQALSCEHCGYLEAVPEVNAADNERAIYGMLDSAQGQADIGGSLVVHCSRCGATTTTSARNQTVDCPFCGTAIQLNVAPDTPVMVPQALVHFEIDEKRARAAVKRWLGRGWLRPVGLAAHASIQWLRGVYIPFFTFDNLLAASYSDEQHYVFWDDILICGSYSLPEKIARALEPFKTQDLVLYQPEFLAGWPSEVSQLSLADASIRARERMMKSMRDEFPLNASITEVSMSLMSYKHVLLPVWVGAYSYEGHLYTFAVNGQTGQAAGGAPRSLAVVYDLLLAPLFVIPPVSLVALLEPALSGLSPAIVPGAVLWVICALVYALSHVLGWRDVDVSQSGVHYATEPASGRPENRRAIEGLVDRLGE